jgi:ubiquitin-protein ligase E3 C
MHHTGFPFSNASYSLSKEAFDADRGMWVANRNQELYPAPYSYARERASLTFAPLELGD